MWKIIHLKIEKKIQIYAELLILEDEVGIPGIRRLVLGVLTTLDDGCVLLNKPREDSLTEDSIWIKKKLKELKTNNNQLN